MKKSLYLLLSLSVMLSLLLVACAPGGPGKTGGQQVAPGKEVTIKLWHGWTDANEVALLNAAIDAYTKAYPGYKVDALSVPFDQLKNKFTTEASTGGGPDLLIGPKDWIGELTKAKLVAELDTPA